MPGLDVADVLDDPDFADVIMVIRESQVMQPGGIAADGPAQTFPNISAVVQPDRGRTLQRMAEGERLTDAIKVYTRFALTGGIGNEEADQVQWNNANYVVVNVRDWSRFGAGFIEAVCDLTDLNPGYVSSVQGQMPAPAPAPTQALQVGGGQIRYAEAAGSPPVAIPANARTELSFVIDPTQTNNYLNPPFAGAVSFDGTTITPRALGDFYHVLVNLLVTSEVAGGSIRFDIDVGSPLGPTGTDTAGLFNDAGVPERVTGNLFIQALSYFKANGAKLYVTSSVPISLVNEAVLINCESS